MLSLLATAGAAIALSRIGHDHRQHKNEQGHLEWSELPTGAKLWLLAAMMLVLLVATGMFFRIYTESIYSGQTWLGLVLAILVAFVLLLSAALVYWTAMRDGSPEQDDLAHYTVLIHTHRTRQQKLEQQAAALDRQIECNRRHAERTRSRAYANASIPMRTADEFITIWRTLRPQHDPVALPTIEPNSAIGAIGHHSPIHRIQADDRPMTTTFGHIQRGPLFGEDSVGSWDPDDLHLPKM